MITFTNVFSCTILGTEEKKETSLPIDQVINHFNMFILGRRGLTIHITSVTPTLVSVHEKSMIGESTMTYAGTVEEMIVVSVLAAQKFCQDNQAAASAAMKSLLAQAQVPA